MNDVTVSDTTNVSPASRKTIVFVGASLMLTVAVMAASFVVYRLGKTGGGNTGQVRDVRSYLPAKQGGSTFSVPSPEPLQGPGPFACDPFGSCNVYEESVRTGCPKTYADRSCLNECEQKDVRCKK